MAKTMAPDFVTPPSGVRRIPVTSIVPTGRPLDEGIKLFLNQDGYGFILEKESEGLWLSPVENTVTASSRGGGTLRNRRWAEGDSFLVLSLHSPSPEHMYDMMARLVDVVTNQGDFFDLVVFDPYSQETRRRTLLYEDGLENLNEATGTYHTVGVTAKFLSPFWRGPERVVTERIAPPVKPLITADPGSPVNRWDDPVFENTVDYEPWTVVDEGLEKPGTGELHGVYATGRKFEVTPGETITVSAVLSYVDGPRVGDIQVWARASDVECQHINVSAVMTHADGPQVGDIQVRARAYDAASQYIYGSASKVISESYGGFYSGMYVVPEAGVDVALGFFTGADVHPNTMVRIETLDVKREGGEIEGAYSFPFFPIFLADSPVQGEHELTVEGDAPVWPVWEITGPGKDVEIIGPGGDRIFIEGEVTSPIRVVTEPRKRSITDDTGLIWERMKPGDDQLFLLQPWINKIKMTMVGGTPESTIKAVYSENWKTPRGTAQGMIRGGQA